MKMGRWKEAAPIVERLLDASAAERQAELSPLAKSDPELAREVETLLRADLPVDSDAAAAGSQAAMDRFLDAGSHPGVQSGTFGGNRGAEAWLGQTLGGYAIDSILGAGGMSTVFKAHRVDGPERPVALKLLDRSFRDDARQRFDRERQLLARLEHPGIARLYDGGATDDDVPYLVMEWVDGEPIDTYCDRLRLGLRDRVVLFLQVADAVAWAHRQLVVHRDIKPANVLVDGSGQARLLDFGIAKTLSEEDSSLTRTGTRPMTVAWASPEQVRGDMVSVPSDVYSLGTLLYWLLTGAAPCGTADASSHDLQRAIVDDEPVPASRRFAEGVDGLEERAKVRGAQPKAIGRLLKGDLDAILGRTLAKETDERYPQVSDLIQDLRDHLEDRPVEARQGNRLSAVAKFVRRHRVGVAASLLVIGSLLFATVQTFVSRVELSKQRDLAQAKRAEADQMTEMALGLLQQSEASGGEAARVAVDEMLRGYVERLDTMNASDASKASSLHALGVVQRELGRAEEAGKLLQRAAELRLGLYGNRSLERSESLEQLATLRQSLGFLKEAEKMFGEVLATRVSRLGANHPDTAMAHNNLGLSLWEQAEFEAAEPHLRAALRIARETLGPLHPGTLSATSNLALVVQGQDRKDEAEALHRLSLEGVAAVFGVEHPRWATAANNLAAVLRKLERFDEAAEIQERVIDVRSAYFGPGHPDTASAIQNMGFIELERGRFDLAEQLMLEARALKVAYLGEDHPLVLASDRGLEILEGARNARKMQDLVER